MSRSAPLVVLLSLCLVCGAAGSEPAWVVEPDDPGADLPAKGRSLFDHLTSRDGRQVVPYPYEALLSLLRDRLSGDSAYLGQTLKQVLIPLGRSLQREAAAPHFFESPRIVLAVDAEPEVTPDDTGMLLRDRLFIAYLEAADVLEVISYNEASARFEFQVVTDYRKNGNPQVRYARRLVCTACHQNAAPIFARPLWDETNANAAIAGQLKNSYADYHGVSARVGVDTAYAIDNATDRANEFTLTQKLWQDGCGSAESGASCRAGLLVRTLQYAFTGGRGFDDGSADYQEKLRQPMHDTRQRLWPEGLWLPNPDIPNRRPLAGYATPALYTGDDADSALARRANVTAAFEPLTPRLPQSTWNPDPDAWVTRTIRGLAQFLAPGDLRRIDDHLAEAAADLSTHSAACTAATSEQQSSLERIKLDCRGELLSFRGLLYHDRAEGSLHGKIRDMALADEDFGSLSINGTKASDGGWQFALKRTGSPYRLRRFNGDEVIRLDLHWQGPEHTQAVAALSVRRDGRLLHEAVRRLADAPNSSLATAPFRRADILPELFASLGLEPVGWCCTAQPALPEPKLEDPEPQPLDSPRLAAFLKACAGCHRSGAPFPPNFLAGTTDQVLRAVAHCGERIQYRLAMWDLLPDERAKSPMPPAQSLSLHEQEGRQWISGMLPELRKALYEITAAASSPLPEQQTTVARPYFELRPCLPAS